MSLKSDNKKIRDSAKGEECTLNIATVCNYNPETTVLCHISTGYGSDKNRVGQRNAVYGCSSCHDWIDNRMSRGGLDSDEFHSLSADRWFYIARALIRTAERRDELGI